MRTDKEVNSSLDYLALCLRCCMFEGDFKSRVVRTYTDTFGETKETAVYMAHELWNSINKRGLVETYQEFIQDDQAKHAIVYAINN